MRKRALATLAVAGLTLAACSTASAATHTPAPIRGDVILCQPGGMHVNVTRSAEHISCTHPSTVKGPGSRWHGFKVGSVIVCAHGDEPDLYARGDDAALPAGGLWAHCL